MTDRTDSIFLAAHEARCTAVSAMGVTCTMRPRCARRLATVPPSAAGMNSPESYTAGGSALCVGYVDAAGLRKAAMQQPARKVHPPIGG